LKSRYKIWGFGPILLNPIGQSVSALPGNSDINLFRYRKCIVDLDAEIPDRAFDLGMSEQS